MKSSKKWLIGILSVFTILLIATIYFYTTQSLWFEKGDTVFFERTNPYPFSIGLDSETGFENLEIRITSWDFSRRQCSPPLHYSFGVDCADRSSTYGLSQCCKAKGYTDVSSGCSGSSGEAVCFKYVSEVPERLLMSYNQQTVWTVTRSEIETASLPITIDLAPYVEPNCAEELSNYQKGLGGELNTKCITDFTFSSSNGKGSMQLSFGTIGRNVQTCHDGIQNQDETRVDYGGVCGTDYCDIRATECPNECDEYTWLTGVCESSTGNCVYTSKENAVECGYVAPEGSTEETPPSPDTSEGTTPEESSETPSGEGEQPTERLTGVEKIISEYKNAMPEINYVVGAVFLIMVSIVAYRLTRKKKKKKKK